MGDETGVTSPAECAVCPIPTAPSFYTAMAMKAAMETDALRASNAVANAQRVDAIALQGIEMSQRAAWEFDIQQARASVLSGTGDATSAKAASSMLAVAAGQLMGKMAQTTPPTTGGAPAPGT